MIIIGLHNRDVGARKGVVNWVRVPSGRTRPRARAELDGLDLSDVEVPPRFDCCGCFHDAVAIIHEYSIPISMKINGNCDIPTD